MSQLLNENLRESLICVSSRCLRNSAFWLFGTLAKASMLFTLESGTINTFKNVTEALCRIEDGAVTEVD
jgi:hypothetical protein